jgi:hypothetical protein
MQLAHPIDPTRKATVATDCHAASPGWIASRRSARLTQAQGANVGDGHSAPRA